MKIGPVPGGWRVRYRGADLKVSVLPPHVARLAAMMPEKAAPDTSNLLLCPMPGLVVALNVAEGEEVQEGQPLAIIEAMKMENVLRAEKGRQGGEDPRRGRREPRRRRGDHGVREMSKKPNATEAGPGLQGTEGPRPRHAGLAHAGGHHGASALHGGRPAGRRGGRAAGASRRSRAACAPPCMPAGRGRSANMPASPRPRRSNAFYRQATLQPGRRGLSVAFDLATHRGYDSGPSARCRRCRQGRRRHRFHRGHEGVVRRHPARRDELCR